MKQICKNCKWWEPLDIPDDFNQEYGLCLHPETEFKQKGIAVGRFFSCECYEENSKEGGLTKMLFGRFYTALEKNGLVSDMKREGGIVTITVLDKFTHMIAKEYVFVMGELVLVRIRGLISNRIIKMIRPRQSYLERLVNKAQEDFMKGCISNEQAEKLIDPGFLKEYPGEFLDKPKEEVIVYVEEKDKRKLCDLLTENGYEFTVSSENAEE